MNWKTELIIWVSILGMMGTMFALAITKNYWYIPTIFISTSGLAWGFTRKFLFEDEQQNNKGVPQ